MASIWLQQYLCPHVLSHDDGIQQVYCPVAARKKADGRPVHSGIRGFLILMNAKRGDEMQRTRKKKYLEVFVKSWLTLHVGLSVGL